MRMEVFKGAVLNIKFGPFHVFFTPLRHDYPSDVTLVLWQYGSNIRGGLLYFIWNEYFQFYQQNILKNGQQVILLM